MSELRGQMDLDELLKGTGDGTQEAENLEGYDAEGNLINPQMDENEQGTGKREKGKGIAAAAVSKSLPL